MSRLTRAVSRANKAATHRPGSSSRCLGCLQQRDELGLLGLAKVDLPLLEGGLELLHGHGRKLGIHGCESGTREREGKMMKEREREKERKRGKEERARSARWSRLCEAATTLWFPPFTLLLSSLSFTFFLFLPRDPFFISSAQRKPRARSRSSLALSLTRSAGREHQQQSQERRAREPPLIHHRSHRDGNSSALALSSSSLFRDARAPSTPPFWPRSCSHRSQPCAL